MKRKDFLRGASLTGIAALLPGVPKSTAWARSATPPGVACTLNSRPVSA
jgi:hypothetical protein